MASANERRFLKPTPFRGVEMSGHREAGFLREPRHGDSPGPPPPPPSTPGAAGARRRNGGQRRADEEDGGDEEEEGDEEGDERKTMRRTTRSLCRCRRCQHPLSQKDPFLSLSFTLMRCSPLLVSPKRSPS
ncbi:unnamed protein product [Lampetra planeri]